MRGYFGRKLVPAVLLACLPLACTRNAPSPGPGTPKVEPLGTPFFRDMTAESGIDFTYRNGEEADHFAILESLGGGVAPDRLTTATACSTSSSPAAATSTAPTRRRSAASPCKLYRNLGDWKFEDVTAEVGLDQPWFYTHGGAVADYDRDGWPDLLVTGYGRVALFHNEPDGKGGRRFVDVTAKAGLHDDLVEHQRRLGRPRRRRLPRPVRLPVRRLVVRQQPRLQRFDAANVRATSARRDGSRRCRTPLPQQRRRHLHRRRARKPACAKRRQGRLRPGCPRRGRQRRRQARRLRRQRHRRTTSSTSTAARRARSASRRAACSAGVARDDHGVAQRQHGRRRRRLRRQRPAVAVGHQLRERDRTPCTATECKGRRIQFRYATQAAGIAAIGQQLRRLRHRLPRRRPRRLGGPRHRQRPRRSATRPHGQASAEAGAAAQRGRAGFRRSHVARRRVLPGKTTWAAAWPSATSTTTAGPTWSSAT